MHLLSRPLPILRDVTTPVFWFGEDIGVHEYVENQTAVKVSKMEIDIDFVAGTEVVKELSIATVRVEEFRVPSPPRRGCEPFVVDQAYYQVGSSSNSLSHMLKCFSGPCSQVSQPSARPPETVE